MSWIWLPHVWEELSHLSRLTDSVAAFVHILEADDMTLGWALEKFTELRGQLEVMRENLTAALQRKFDDMMTWRDAFFMKSWLRLLFNNEVKPGMDLRFKHDGSSLQGSLPQRHQAA